MLSDKSTTALMPGGHTASKNSKISSSTNKDKFWGFVKALKAERTKGT